MADGLLVMSELGAGYTVFDIEYVQKSPTAVDPDFLRNELPAYFAEEFAIINQNILDLFGAIESGALPMEVAADYINDLTMLNDQTKDILISKVAEVTRDNDQYFGNAVKLFRDVFLTVNMVDDYEVDLPEDYESWILDNVAYQNINVDSKLYPRAESIDPALPLLLQNSEGAGFPNIIIDNDGVRRRVDLFAEYKGRFFAQLAMAPFLEWIGSPELNLTDDYLIIKDAMIPGDEEAKDIKIPRTETGEFLLNWPSKGYWESFRLLSYYYMVLHDWQEEALIADLKLLESDQYFYYYEGDQDIFGAYDYAESIKTEILAGGDRGYLQDYRDAREYFYSEVGNFINGQAESAIRGQIQDILNAGGLSEAEIEDYKAIDKNVESNFAEVRVIYNDYMITRDKIRGEVEGSFCIIGSSATSTFDRGVNPFSKEYANVGTHAAIVNMIIQNSFLDDAPQWISILLAIVITFLLYLIIHKMDALPSIIWGIVIVIVIGAVEIGVFLISGIYIQLLTPV
jgi:adenylate cyclase